MHYDTAGYMMGRTMPNLTTKPLSDHHPLLYPTMISKYPSQYGCKPINSVHDPVENHLTAGCSLLQSGTPWYAPRFQVAPQATAAVPTAVPHLDQGHRGSLASSLSEELESESLSEELAPPQNLGRHAALRTRKGWAPKCHQWKGCAKDAKICQ